MVRRSILVDNSLSLPVGTVSRNETLRVGGASPVDKQNQNRKIAVQDKRQLQITRLTHESNAVQQSGRSALRGLRDCYGIKSS
jgi:hypothetical protein